LTNANITCIFISVRSFDTLLRCVSNGLREPIPILFPSYTEAQFKDILVYLFDSYYERKKYDESTAEDHIVLIRIIKEHEAILCHILQNIIETFIQVITNLNEFFNVAKILLLDYARQVQLSGGFSKPDDDIIKELCGTFSERIHQVYQSLTRSNILYLSNDGSLRVLNPLMENKTTQAIWKYILIAAYLASHNTIRYDRQLFMPETKKAKLRNSAKTAASIAKKEGNVLAKQFRAPKRFKINRLLYLFQMIISKEPSLQEATEKGFIRSGTQAMVLQQVKLLVDLGLLKTKQPISLDPTAQFSCTANFDYIQSIALSINFQIHHYLENPY